MKTTKVNVYTLNGKLLRSFVPGTGFAQPKKSKRVVFEFDERDMDALKNMAINGNYSHWMETRKQQYQPPKLAQYAPDQTQKHGTL